MWYRRFNSTEIEDLYGDSSCETDDECFDPPSDEEFNFDEQGASSDIENELEIEREESDAEKESDDESLLEENGLLTGKDGTKWFSNPIPDAQTRARNILKQKGGPHRTTLHFTAKQIFKTIISDDIRTIVLRETNRKFKRVCDDYNKKLLEDYPDPSLRPPFKSIETFTEVEFDAFIGILIMAGVHRSNRENFQDMWSDSGLPLIRAAMSRDRFALFIKFIRFDNENTRASRIATDKAAPIRDIWTMLNENLSKGFAPFEGITVDEQLFPFRGKTRFTQYIPSKPAKYGIKIFWACDSTTGYPLKSIIYTGKPIGGERQVNVGQETVLDLVKVYKGTGRNICCDNFFTTFHLAEILVNWKMTVVGTVRKNKKFLPKNMLPNKERPIYSTNFAYNNVGTVCSYVPKKNKAVVLFSSMHLTGEVEDTQAAKPEIITYYNRNKGAVDSFDKCLGEYTCKRKTLRWPLALFFNAIDIAAYATYIIYREHNPHTKSREQRRKFLKELANELCLPAVELRSKTKSIRVLSCRLAIETVLGKSVSTATVTQLRFQTPQGSRGHAAVVGSCYLCRLLEKRQRKTRKSCVDCSKPVCDEHSLPKTTCLNCNSQT